MPRTATARRAAAASTAAAPKSTALPGRKTRGRRAAAIGQNSGNSHADPATAAAAADINGAASVHEPPGWAGQLRVPLSWSLQTLMLMLHAGEELQRAQLDCWHLALKRHEQAHKRLLGCEDTAEMASVHADLLRFDTANLTNLSQRCLDAGVHLNTDLARLIAQTLDGSRHHLMRSAFETFQSGLRTGIRPLDEIFNAPLLRELVEMPRPRSSA